MVVSFRLQVGSNHLEFCTKAMASTVTSTFHNHMKRVGQSHHRTIWLIRRWARQDQSLMRSSLIDYLKIMQKIEVSWWVRQVREVGRWLPRKHRRQRTLGRSRHRRFKRSIWSSTLTKTSRRHQLWSLVRTRWNQAQQTWAALVEADSAGPSPSVVVWVEVESTMAQDDATISYASLRTPHTLTQS